VIHIHIDLYPLFGTARDENFVAAAAKKCWLETYHPFVRAPQRAIGLATPVTTKTDVSQRRKRRPPARARGTTGLAISAIGGAHNAKRNGYYRWHRNVGLGISLSRR
jgi:hypothetical protein